MFPDPEEWINPGDSVVVAPGGEVVAGPMHAEQGILFADIEPARAAAARRTLDVAGHYSRPDIFQLEVDRGSRDPVTYR
jgi:nitrilase